MGPTLKYCEKLNLRPSLQLGLSQNKNNGQGSEKTPKETKEIQPRNEDESDIEVEAESSKQEAARGGWWKGNSGKYSVLSEVTRHVLVVPVSTVASESTFNTGGQILDAFRSFISPATVEALICSQSWLRSIVRNLDVKQEMDMVVVIEEVGNELAAVVRMD